MSKTCDSHCGSLATDRMRYFTGRYMTARDFRDEQMYQLTHRYLHNRMLHGWGVVCGMHIHPHRVPDCRPNHVVVDCGMAIDCCGREIVVPRSIVAPPIDWAQRPADGPPRPPSPKQEQAQPPYERQVPSEERDDSRQYPPDQDEPPRDPRDHDDDHDRDHDDERHRRRWCALLCLEYCESDIEVVPVLYSEHTCDKSQSEHSRVREGFTFKWHWVRYDELVKYHWKTRGGGHRDREDEHEGHHDGHHNGDDQHDGHNHHHHHGHPCPEDDCDDEGGHHGARCCLDPDCPPHHCVPLAVICVKPGEPIEANDIETIGRPSLEPPVHSLTHISGINWPHGGIVSRRQVERHLNRLEIRFDRRLKKPDTHTAHGPVGVNACTFLVQFGGGYEDLDFVTYSEPPKVEHDCIAVFTMDPRGHKGHGDLPYAYLEHHTIFIALKCDFVLDCHGDPVDGNHLGGVLPSGDGIRGGTFESWFRVLPDHEWDRQQQEQRV